MNGLISLLSICNDSFKKYLGSDEWLHKLILEISIIISTSVIHRYDKSKLIHNISHSSNIVINPLYNVFIHNHIITNEFI